MDKIYAVGINEQGVIQTYATDMPVCPDRQLYTDITIKGTVLSGYAVYEDKQRAAARANRMRRDRWLENHKYDAVITQRGRVVYMLRAVDPDA